MHANQRGIAHGVGTRDDAQEIWTSAHDDAKDQGGTQSSGKRLDIFECLNVKRFPQRARHGFLLGLWNHRILLKVSQY
jgi:hypothetical protein